MAADPLSYTLADYALNSNDPLVQKISMSLIMNGMALQDIPMIDYKSLTAKGIRVQGNNLPSVGWRNLNDDPVTTKGTPTAFQEQAFTLSNNIDIDKKFLQDINSIQDPFAQQLGMYLKAVSYDYNDKFINNNHVTGDPKSFVGLKDRLDNVAWGNEAEMKIDCGGVDLSQAGLTATSANNFLEFIDQALAYMGDSDGNGVVIYCNDLMMRRIPRAIRLLGAGAGFEMTTDAFARRVPMYRNARIVDLGRKADQTTRIITNTETAAGKSGGTVMTSVYFVKYGLEDAVKGWQFDSLEQSINGPFLLQNGVQQRLNIDWTTGIFQENTRAISRLYDIKTA